MLAAQIWIILAEKRSARGSPEKSGERGSRRSGRALPRPFEGTTASDLDRTYYHTKWNIDRIDLIFF